LMKGLSDFKESWRPRWMVCKHVGMDEEINEQ
jgi:hypothetical protein